MRDRLIELVGCAIREYDEYSTEMFDAGNDDYEDMEEYVADYLLKRNTFVPPCNVGNVVYKVVCTNKGDCCGIADFNCEDCPYQNRHVVEGNVIAIKYVEGIRLKVKFDKFTDYFCDDEVYFTKEEAEKALRKEQNNG